MAHAHTVDLDCDQYATFIQQIQRNDANGDPINLTNYTARMTVRDAYGGLVLITLTESAGITLGGGTGLITIRIEAAVTATFAAGNYVYDLLTISGAGTALKPIRGEFKVWPGATTLT